MSAAVKSLLAALVKVERHRSEFFVSIWVQRFRTSLRAEPQAQEYRQELAAILRAHPEAMLALAVEALGAERVMGMLDPQCTCAPNAPHDPSGHGGHGLGCPYGESLRGLPPAPELDALLAKGTK